MRAFRPFREADWPLPLLRLRPTRLFRGVELTVLGVVFVVGYQMSQEGK